MSISIRPFLGYDIRWVVNARMQNPLKGPHEGFGDRVKVFQGQRRLIELSFAEQCHNECLNAFLDPGGRGIGESPARGLDHVSEHDQRSFLALWAWSGIPVFIFTDRLMTFFCLFQGLVIKKLY